MKTNTLEFHSVMPATADQVFAWHSQPGAFAKLLPPGERVEILEHLTGLRDGAVAKFRIHLGPIPVEWVAVHKGVIEGKQFIDEQLSGPFAFWRHTHLFKDDAPGTSVLIDHIEYRMPLGPVSDFIAGPFVKTRLSKMFEYRHAVTKAELAQHNQTDVTRQ